MKKAIFKMLFALIFSLISLFSKTWSMIKIGIEEEICVWSKLKMERTVMKGLSQKILTQNEVELIQSEFFKDCRKR
ncbi:MAG: hypothetical protein AAGB24_12080 [Bacteroidota bacterium]